MAGRHYLPMTACGYAQAGLQRGNLRKNPHLSGKFGDKGVLFFKIRIADRTG
jgi:hypothetical protein